MAKPSAALADFIWRLPRTNRRRAAELLHITLLRFGNLAILPPRYLSAVERALDDFAADAFYVVFDRIEERGCVMLRGSDPMAGVNAFHGKLTSFLDARALPFLGRSLEPHLTINYHRDGRAGEAFDPISWLVEEIVLVESIVGQTRHVEHGRWRLSART